MNLSGNDVAFAFHPDINEPLLQDGYNQEDIRFYVRFRSVFPPYFVYVYKIQFSSTAKFLLGGSLYILDSNYYLKVD